MWLISTWGKRLAGMFFWSQALQDFVSMCFCKRLWQQKAFLFSVIKSSDTTLVGLFRATSKERMIVAPLLYRNSLFCRGNEAVLQRRVLYHPLKIASSVRSGVILWASGTHHQLYYNGDVHHIAAGGSGGISIITLHYQGKKSWLGEKMHPGIKFDIPANSRKFQPRHILSALGNEKLSWQVFSSKNICQ